MADPINHQKPTTEELEAQIKANQEEIDRQIAEDNKPSEPIPSEPDPSEPVPSDEVPSEPEPSEPDPSEPVPSEPIKETQEEIDYKKRATESAREAQILHARNKMFSEATEIPEPTEAELMLEYPEWDEMSATERKLAKDNVWNNRRFAKIDQVAKESKDIDAWNTKVDTFITDPKSLLANPELEGKQEAFKIFAGKPTRRGLDIEDIVLAFLGDVAKNKPAPKKGQMFEGGSSGPNTPMKPKDDKISVEEAAILQQKDYKKWKEYLIAGKIKSA